MKKLKFLLQHIDGIWSLPVAFFIFWFVGSGLLSVFGYGTGTYDPGLLQAFFLATFIVIGATNVVVWGLYFNFRILYKFMYGERDPEGKIINYSKNKWKSLTSWQQYVVCLFVFFSYFWAIVIVTLNLI